MPSIRTSFGGNAPMPARSGRLEKRIRLAVPVQIARLLDPATAERTTTENVCSLGMRGLTQRARELNERLMISSLVGDLRALARVVYCFFFQAEDGIRDLTVTGVQTCALPI